LVSPKTALLVGFVAATYLVSLTYYVQSYEAYTAAADSVSIYIAIEPPPVPNGNDSYSPNIFIVGEGQHVTLVVHNADSVTHGLAIDNFSVNTGPIRPDDTISLNFDPNQLGTFTFYEPTSECAVGGGVCDSLFGTGSNQFNQLTGNMTVITPKI